MTFPLTAEHLIASGAGRLQVALYLDELNSAMQSFEIDTGERPAMFLAQVAHESGGFRYVEELWGPTPAQSRYRDGREWCGHGLIQITGRHNHMAEATFFSIAPSQIVAWLKSPHGACQSAAHFWAFHGCNELADQYDLVGITRRINGGLNGLADRAARYQAILNSMSS